MSSPSKESLQFVPELLEIAREYSMLGNYKQSCLIYDSITERLSAFLKLNEKNQIWSSMKQMIESEVSLVRELYQSTQHLKPKKVPAVSRLVDHFGVEPFSNMNQSQDPLQQPFDNFEVNEVIQKNPKYIRKPPVNPNLNKPKPNLKPPVKPPVPTQNHKPAAPANKSKVGGAPPGGKPANLKPNLSNIGYGDFDKDEPNAPNKSKIGNKPDSKDNKGAAPGGENGENNPQEGENKEGEVPEERKYEPPLGCEEMASIVNNEILERNTGVKWEDIAGLKDAKQLLFEAVILPLVLPGYFQGLREPWKGILLFGPPGTGKTMLAKALCADRGITFFNVSLATITSKWRGDSEKFIKILFQMARFYAPSIIFIDEIDSLCSKRGASGEHEASRRVLNVLLVEMSGVQKEGEEKKQVLLLGATNHPWDVDDAMIRRLEKRVYIPLPDCESRKDLLAILLGKLNIDESVDFEKLADLTSGYSAADIKTLCRDASMMDLRFDPGFLAVGQDITKLKEEAKKKEEELQKKPLTFSHFKRALAGTKSSVIPETVEKYEKWNILYGSKQKPLMNTLKVGGDDEFGNTNELDTENSVAPTAVVANANNNNNPSN